MLLCVLFASAPFAAYAANISYKVDTAGISLSLPQEMYVFTRDVLPTDERIAALGLTYEGLMSSFEAQDMYLEAMDTEAFNEIVVIAESTTETNYYELGYNGLYNAALSEEKALEDSGRKVISSDLYENNDVDFVKTISESTDSQLQYTTVYNNKKIKIRLIDFDGKITEDEAESFESIVDTVTFAQKPVVTKKEEPKPAVPAAAEPEPQQTAQSDAAESKDGASGSVDKLGRLLLIIAAACAVCTIPALLFRFVFAGGGMSKGGALVFAVFYSLAMTALFYYAVTSYPQLKLSIFICIVPLVWSLAIYKIVKR